MTDDVWAKARAEFRSQICREFDVPVWVVEGSGRPVLFRVRWAMRRVTGWDGSHRRRNDPDYRTVVERGRQWERGR